jgi:hypothetical protein
MPCFRWLPEMEYLSFLSPVFSAARDRVLPNHECVTDVVATVLTVNAAAGQEGAAAQT